MGQKKKVDRYQTENLFGKTRTLRARQAELEIEVLKTGDLDKYRELNMVNHKIRVTEERRIGGWGSQAHSIQSTPRIKTT